VRHGLACGLIRNADAMAINHLPALPAREQQSADRDQRKHEARGNDRRGATAVAEIPIDGLDYDNEDVTAGVPPGIGQVKDAANAA
jgi:hypothetical protein